MKDIFLYYYFIIGRWVIAGMLGSLSFLGPVWASMITGNAWFLLLIVFFPLCYHCGQRIIGEI